MRHGRPIPTRRAGFSLAELLVAIGIIAVLGGLTVIAVRGIAKDTRMSSAVNTVSAVLDNARGLALKSNRVVLVVFRPRLIGDQEQVVEAVIAQWTGQSYFNNNMGVIDRFLPVDGVKFRRLPVGIKVAGPRYGESFSQSFDERWVTQPHLPEINPDNPVGGANERPGEAVGVMYGPDGTVLTRNPQSDANRLWVDFNVDPEQVPTIRLLGIDYLPGDNAVDNGFFEQRLADDEPFVNMSPFLAVFDDEEAREQRTNEWTSEAGYDLDLTGVVGYISRLGRRIHFNRYTGVVMTSKAQ